MSNANNYYRSGVMRVPTDGGTAQGSATSWTDGSYSYSTQWLDDSLCTTQTTTFSISQSSLTSTDTNEITSNTWSRGAAGSGNNFQFRGADSGNTFRGATVT